MLVGGPRDDRELVSSGYLNRRVDTLRCGEGGDGSYSDSMKVSVGEEIGSMSGADLHIEPCHFVSDDNTKYGLMCVVILCEEQLHKVVFIESTIASR